MAYFFDSYAIIEILKNNQNYKRFENEEIITSDLNIGEVYYFLLRTLGRKKADFWYEILHATIIPIDSNSVINAMNFRYFNKKKKLSIIDCIGYKLALKNKLRFLTGDKEFKNIPFVEFVSN